MFRLAEFPGNRPGKQRAEGHAHAHGQRDLAARERFEPMGLAEERPDPERARGPDRAGGDETHREDRDHARRFQQGKERLDHRSALGRMFRGRRITHHEGDQQQRGQGHAGHEQEGHAPADERDDIGKRRRREQAAQQTDPEEHRGQGRETPRLFGAAEEVERAHKDRRAARTDQRHAGRGRPETRGLREEHGPQHRQRHHRHGRPARAISVEPDPDGDLQGREGEEPGRPQRPELLRADGEIPREIIHHHREEGAIELAEDVAGRGGGKHRAPPRQREGARHLAQRQRMRSRIET